MPDFNGGPDSGSVDTPCGSSTPYFISTVIQTRMLTTLGPVGLDCSLIYPGMSPCDYWRVTMQQHTPHHCPVSIDPPPDYY